jgi:hypothetical protein
MHLLCRRRDTVMCAARIGYVRCAHRLCWRRASVMSAASIGYVRCAHLCIKAVGITVITVTIGAIPHFLLWVVYMQWFCEMKMGWIMRKSSDNGYAHKKGHTALWKFLIGWSAAGPVAFNRYLYPCLASVASFRHFPYFPYSAHPPI